MSTKIDPKLAEDIVRMRDIPGFRRLLDHVSELSSEADGLAVSASDPDARAVLAGRARAYREIIQLMSIEPRRH